MKLQVRKTILILITILLSTSLYAADGAIKGTITDRSTKEPLIGATVQIVGSTLGTVADLDGNFELSGLTYGTYHLEIKYVSYQTAHLNEVKVGRNESAVLTIDMEPESLQLGDVTVVAQVKRNTDLAMLTSTRNSLLVQTGVSAQQIARTQDRNATEVIKRVPGISIIDDKFVIVRGLSQRYNNVWINNAAVPSSEADSRAFSFDIIPSSQLDNIVIVKSPAPELPADFTGGFIKIATKDVPDKNAFSVTYGTGINDRTHFRNFLYTPGSATDVLGFDNGMRSTGANVPIRMDNNNSASVTDITRNGFNNNWLINSKRALPDQKLNLAYNLKTEQENGQQWALLSAFNYSLGNKAITAMENSRFGIYDSKEDEPKYYYRYTDNQYTTNVHLGGMLNLTYLPNNRDKYELKNIVNQIAQDKYTERSGYQNASGLYQQEKYEYLYSSRTTYSGQLSATYNRESSKLDWELGYSYANKNQPDRRIINRQENDNVNDAHYGDMQIDQRDIQREFSTLNEHIFSLGLNYFRELQIGTLRPSIKVGAYADYRTRNYHTRSFYYQWDVHSMPDDFTYGQVVNDILIDNNYGADKLYLYEDTDNRNSYSGDNTLFAGYAAVNLPINRFTVYAGVRYENNRKSLKSYTSLYEFTTKTKNYNEGSFFPSVNTTYKLNEKQLLRLAYGTSVNRPEFREVSSSVYFDFDLFSNVQGNPKLKTAYIQNLDFRYEWYPSNGESVSIALFYKKFKNPIEWTYLDSGGGNYTYLFENARSADNFGVELDIRKNLSFIGLPAFTWSFNGALIKSQVNFEAGSLETERPMQGQSPYLVNTGLFYSNERWGMNVGVMYNRIGKRIVGVGRVDTSEGGSVNNDIPNAYEMPRNMVDLSLSKKLGKRVELKLSARDLISDAVTFKQYPKFYDTDNQLQEREQTTKSYRPGRSYSISVSVNL